MKEFYSIPRIRLEREKEREKRKTLPSQIENLQLRNLFQIKLSLLERIKFP